MTVKRTWGGIPENEAFAWNNEKRKKLGEIIGNIHSGDPARQKKGYIDYYEFKRHFMIDVWSDFINRIDNFRIGKGFLRVEDMVKEIGKKVTSLTIKENPLPKTTAPDISNIMPKTAKTKAIDKIEQLSLF